MGRAEACRRVGKDAHAVAAVARDLGVGWATIMRAVADHGRPLLGDPIRLEGVAALGLDETSFLKATRLAPTRWVTGPVDLERGRLLDVVADRTRAGVAGWLHARPRGWLAHIAAVALDPWRGDASALAAPLGHATVVVVASAGCCRRPLSTSPSGDECGCGLGWRLGILVVRWPRPGRARNSCALSTERSGPAAAARAASTASTTGQTASRFRSCRGWPHRTSLGGRDPGLPRY